MTDQCPKCYHRHLDYDDESCVCGCGYRAKGEYVRIADLHGDEPEPEQVQQHEREQEITEQIHKWWHTLAEKEASEVVPKAVAYGAHDLEVMGKALEGFLPEDMRNGVVGQEMACAFYALGKVARIVGAYVEGRTPSDDSWHDLGVYCRMAQRIRETGKWV